MSGSPVLVNEMKKIITKTDVEPDEEWGLDHGCRSVVKSICPLAVKENDEKVKFFNDKLVMGSLSMTSVKIG